MESIASNATADIDWMEVTGYNPSIGNCSQTSGRVATAATVTTATNTTGVYPNPANGKINVGFDVPEIQKVSFIILDAAGNPVGNIRSQLYPAGYNVQSYNMTGKTSGIYTILVNGDRNLRQAFRFIVIQ